MIKLRYETYNTNIERTTGEGAGGPQTIMPGTLFARSYDRELPHTSNSINSSVYKYVTVAVWRMWDALARCLPNL